MARTWCVYSRIGSSVAPARCFHFVNRLDRLRDVQFGPGEGLVVDEICLGHLSADDAKSLCDLEYQRDVYCRNQDGAIGRSLEMPSVVGGIGRDKNSIIVIYKSLLKTNQF